MVAFLDVGFKSVKGTANLGCYEIRGGNSRSAVAQERLRPS